MATMAWFIRLKRLGGAACLLLFPLISAAAPERIVSINLCADQLLLLLADPQQIAALTHLSHDPAASYLHSQARTYPSTQGLAEEVLPFRPDLVIAGEYGGLATISLLQKLGIRVETLAIANSITDSFRNIRQLANWTGHPERGEQLVASMQQRLSELLPAPPQRPLAAVYDPNGYTVGPNSLRGQAMTQAGWANAGELAGIDSYGTLSLEALIRLQPQALLDSPYTLNTWSRAEALAQHPALRASQLQPHSVPIPSAMTLCDGPWLVEVIERLQAARLRVSPPEQP